MDKFFDWLYKENLDFALMTDMRMLIGYMLEYIRDHEYWENHSYNKYANYYAMSIWAKDHYKILKEIIEELSDG